MGFNSERYAGVPSEHTTNDTERLSVLTGIVDDRFMHTERQPQLMDIHRAFSETEFGQTLADQVRYDRYKPADVTNERWVELLGADVGNLTHLPLTFGLTRDFITQLRQSQPGFLDEGEESVLQTAALIHDWAEAVVGDITYSDKSDEDEVEERNQLAGIIDKLEDNSPELRELIDRALEEVVFTPDTKLGQVFNTVERVGYVRTALRASQHVLESSAPDCEEGLRWIVADVFGNHPEALIERSFVYAPVKKYLLAKKDEISLAFRIVGPETFENYPTEDQRKLKEYLFYKSRGKFHAWLRGKYVPG